MANTQKKSPAKSSGKSTSAPKKEGAKTTAKKPEKAKRPIRREIGGILCLLLALCVVVGYFQPDGWLIQLLPKLFKGLMGYGFHLVAPALLVAGVILLRHHGRPVAFRVTCALLIPPVWGSLAHLIFCKVDLSSTSGLIPKLWKSGLEVASGGVLSGAVAHGVMAVFGHIATAVIFAVLLVVFVTVISHRLIGKMWTKWRERERYEEEEEEEPPVVVPVKKPEAKTAEKKTPRSVIDIPLDEEEGPKREKRPGVLSGFFRQKSKDQKTPDEVLRARPEQKKGGETSMDSPFVEDLAGEPRVSVTTSQRERSGISAPRVIRETPVAEEVPFKSAWPPAEEEKPFAAPVEETVAEPAAVPAEEEISARRRKANARAEVEHAAAEVSAEIDSNMDNGSVYSYPPITLLNQSSQNNPTQAGAELRSNEQRLADTLNSFGVDALPGDVIRGPSVTRYEFILEQGVKLSKITNLSDDIALALGASGVRIAPVPDKISVVGIEVPNKNVSPVLIRDVLESRSFVSHKSSVAFTVGRDIANNDIVGDIAKLPHVLIAGTTGSGKSVCTNSLIISLLYKSTPEEVRFIMVDPKMVELAPYNGIPHLLIPVVTDPKKAAGALQWAVFEMMKRYKTFSEMGVKKLEEYNALAEKSEDIKKMATVVVVIDELADLMLVAAKEVEESICRVAQMGRAAGIHLVIATQRPSADVITGLMKANIPSRIAFAVASSLESRIILDNPGAEKLVGRGDMLYAPLGEGKPRRVQGCFISPEEIDRVVSFVKQSGEAQYSDEVMAEIEKAMAEKEKGNKKNADRYDGSTTAAVEAMEGDEVFPAAVEAVLEVGMASVSMLQRRLKLGYSRAARLVDQMEEQGIVGPFEGSKPRQVLITKQQWQELQMKKNGGDSAMMDDPGADDVPWDEA